jgi:Zn finger protein HypA/HybF involved in hydrogenase expression
VPRLLFYAFLAILAAMWMRRLAAGRSASTAPKGPRVAKGMPQRLVCGACGKEYEPLTNGWLCPQCHH